MSDEIAVASSNEATDRRESTGSTVAQHWFDRAVTRETLPGGLIATVTRLTLDDGSTVIVKQDPTAMASMFELEAEGLAALRAEGAVRVPDVLDWSEHHIAVEDLGPRRPVTDDEWRQLGRDLATLHGTRSPDGRFGWDRDGYQGRMAQPQPWTDDGVAFYADQRILRWLPEEKCRETLTAGDVAGVERCCARLPDLGLEGGAVLTHGDLWSGNIVPLVDGGLALIDPSVSWNWAETDLTTMDWDPSVPNAAFFGGYEEVRPIADGREDRWAVLHLREHLAMVAHFGDEYGTLPRLRATLDRFR